MDVVSLEWLAEHRMDAGVRIVDVREPWEYDGIGHIPGAVSIPFDRFRDKTGPEPGTLPGADAFGTLLGEAGITPKDTIVAYDDTFGVFAARFLFTAAVYGHTDCRLVAGDYSAWNREYETTTEAPALEATTYEPKPRSGDGPLIDRSGVEAALERGALFVDTREREEFEEARLPGAVRFDWRSTVDEDARQLKSREALEALLAEYGITREREIVLYCNTARRISHTYLVLRWLGFENVSFYEGSLTDWLAADGAVETGPQSPAE